MISSPQAELQKLLFEQMTGNATLMALANGVYDFVPPDPFETLSGTVNGYITFGPTQVLNDDSECIIGQEHMVQIDCWSRQKNTVHCKRMVDTVASIFNEKSFPMVDNALVGITVQDRRVFADPDGLTTHGMLTLMVYVEETE
jgi:hypothetical protein